MRLTIIFLGFSILFLSGCSKALLEENEITDNQDLSNQDNCEEVFSGPGEIVWSKLIEDSYLTTEPKIIHQDDNLLFLVYKREYRNSTLQVLSSEDGSLVYSLDFEDFGEVELARNLHFEEQEVWIDTENSIEVYEKKSGILKKEIPIPFKPLRIMKAGQNFLAAELQRNSSKNTIVLHLFNQDTDTFEIVGSIPFESDFDASIGMIGYSQKFGEKAYFVVGADNINYSYQYKICSVDLNNRNLDWTKPLEVSSFINLYSELYLIEGLAFIPANHELFVCNLEHDSKIQYSIPFRNIRASRKLIELGEDIILFNGLECGMRFNKYSGRVIFKKETPYGGRFQRFSTQVYQNKLYSLDYWFSGFSISNLNTLEFQKRHYGPRFECPGSQKDFFNRIIINEEGQLFASDPRMIFRIDLD